MKIKKSNLLVFCLTLAFIFSISLPVLAAAPNIGVDYANNLGLTGNNQDPRDMAVSIVRYLMTFLGLIAVVVIMFGGFRWMTAGGNEDRIAESKKLILSGVIGLIVVLGAFAIVQFVINTSSNLLG